MARTITFLLLALATCSKLANAARSLDNISSLLEFDRDRNLKGKDDRPKCPDTGGKGNPYEESFYNIYVEIKDLPDKCDEDDREAIGYLVQDIIEEEEDKVPLYKGEEMDGKICKNPQPTMTTTTRFLLDSNNQSRRRLGSYTYRGSGRCRRCKRSRRSRMLRRSLGSDDKRKFDSYIDEACHYAEAGKFYADMADSAVQSANEEYQEVLELLVDYYDPRKGEEKKKKALESLEKCEEEALNSLDAASMCMSWCEKAEEEASEKEQKKCSEESKKAYEDVAKSTDKARDKYYDVKKAKWELIEESIKNEYKLEREGLKDSIEATEEAMKEEIKELKEAIEDLKDDIKEEKEEDLKKLKEEDLELLEDQVKQLEKYSEVQGKFLEEQGKREEQIALARVAMHAADSMDDYLGGLKTLMENVMPATLLRAYNDTNPPGCLSASKEPTCKVKIEPTIEENKEETGGQYC